MSAMPQGSMDLPGLFAFLQSQPLLTLAMIAILTSVLGGMLRGAVPWLGRLLRGLGNLGLVAALLLTVAQVARLNQSLDMSLPGQPRQEVSGGETRIPMERDGHFWITAEINGVEQRFLVDTGATLTALSEETASRAGVAIQDWHAPVVMRTANGTTTAKLANVGELRFGNVVARDLDAVIVPGIGEMNVIGMNLLSRLASWRVEGRTLILVPNNPQPESGSAS